MSTKSPYLGHNPGKRVSLHPKGALFSHSVKGQASSETDLNFSDKVETRPWSFRGRENLRKEILFLIQRVRVRVHSIIQPIFTQGSKNYRKKNRIE